MNKRILLFLFALLAQHTFSQSYAPAAGLPGSTAIHKDSSILLSWAKSCTVELGPMQIDHPEYGLASFGNESNGVGAAEGNSLDIVSLGDGGTATLTFNPPITNGPGPDFAVFENGFLDHYMEFAFVEVSSNGVDFYRFPAFSETPLSPQITNGTFGNCEYIHNLAGKYRQGFGTPFDLQDLDSIADLDLQAVAFIRLVDVVGIGDSTFGTRDCLGRIINDPWPTNFESSGFDLDGIGVIHEGELSISKQSLTNSIYPNPFHNQIVIKTNQSSTLRILDNTGLLLFQKEISTKEQISLDFLASGIYYFELKYGTEIAREKIIKL